LGFENIGLTYKFTFDTKSLTVENKESKFKIVFEIEEKY